MNDRELLELAAKAAGLDLWFDDSDTPWVGGDMYIWNPLTDDGDALRLAVKLGFCININLCDEEGYQSASVWKGKQFRENSSSDLEAATRLAIVRAAAEIGRAI